MYSRSMKSSSKNPPSPTNCAISPSPMVRPIVSRVSPTCQSSKNFASIPFYQGAQDQLGFAARTSPKKFPDQRTSAHVPNLEPSPRRNLTGAPFLLGHEAAVDRHRHAG